MEKEPPKKSPPKKLPGASDTPRKDAPAKDRGVDEKRVDPAPSRTARTAAGWSAVLVSLVFVWAVGAAPNPPQLQERSLVSLTGTVGDVRKEAFVLDFVGGSITIEMDDWEAADEAWALRRGERVTVYGRVDGGFYERRTIAAKSIYSYDHRTYDYADERDEAGDHFALPFAMTAVPEGSWVTVSGTIGEIDGRRFTLRTSGITLEIDTAGMPYDPLDDDGVQQLDAGERVTVWGVLDAGLFDRRTIRASTIVSVTRGGQRMAAARVAPRRTLLEEPG